MLRRMAVSGRFWLGGARAAVVNKPTMSVGRLAPAVKRCWQSTAMYQEKKTQVPEELMADHSWRQTNHIWSEEELRAIEARKHEPKTLGDTVARLAMTGLYRGFNFATGYESKNPTVQSVAWRLIILESFAGVPGFIAAAFRHFYSLRALKRDHGAIFTFLEEAENERMHLLVCLKLFQASFLTRLLVQLAQLSLGPALTLIYLIHPSLMHRFVGYLEETAVETYGDIIDRATTPGTHLHQAWHQLEAPLIAKAYWKLPDNATWIQTLEHIRADEAHHRDVNHCFADLHPKADNPFVKGHIQDFDKAALLRVQAALASHHSTPNVPS